MVHWKVILTALVAGSLAAVPMLHSRHKDGHARQQGASDRGRRGQMVGRDDQGNGPGGPGNQGNGDSGKGDSGNGDSGNGDSGNGDSGNGNGGGDGGGSPGPGDGGNSNGPGRGPGSDGGHPPTRPGNGGSSPAPRVQPPGTDGLYNITVGGPFHGTGTATVGGSSVSMTASVSDENGNKGDFSAPSLAIDGNYFRGTGTVMGVQMTLIGRLESPEGANDGPATSATTRPPRMVCNFTTSDGRRGRVAGFVAK